METRKFKLPEWTFEFHSHSCPFLPIGFRMGTLAFEKLEVQKSFNHEMHVFSEMGIGHPQGCMQDGIMSVTFATFGKGMIERYLRVKDRKKVCTSFSDRAKEEAIFNLPNYKRGE